ncbi:MAG: M14 metallopeptidase family protein [Bacteroidales bacterium]
MKRMKSVWMVALTILLTVPVNASTVRDEPVKSPDSYFGFQPGSDGNLFNYKDLIGYLKDLEKVSSCIKLEEIGTSPMGKKIYIAFISSEENIARLPEFKEMNRELALNPGLDESTRAEYFREGRTFVLATLSMHSSEVGPSQAAPLIAYDLVTTKDENKLKWMNDVVYMMVPSHNPDGMDMIVDDYKKHKGTKYDGASLPDVYHKYVGHDNNRDFVILSQEDTKAIAAIYNQTWYPQVMVEKHQMGSTGVRYFVPPNHDPIAENVPAGIFSWSGLFGQNMANDMTGAGLAGVAQHYLFDDYWPGSTETCIWKNVIGFLTEAASVRTASPIYIEPGELRVGGKGLSEYKKSINMLLPWEGGWWRLGDIVEYEIVSTMSILKTASLYREEILRFRNDICREMVETGKNKPPYYYILPQEQHDAGELVNLAALLKEHGVNLFKLEQDIVIDDIAHHRGDIVVPLAQPFRAFIKEVMEHQEFPERHYTPGGELIKPYDITSWSLPLHRHVKSFEVNTRSGDLENNISPLVGEFSMAQPMADYADKVILPVNYNESFKAAFKALEEGMEVSRLKGNMSLDGKVVKEGSFVISLDGKKGTAARQLVENLDFPVISVSGETELQTEAMKIPRIALVETYFHDMDAGWTRYIFDSYSIPFKKVRPHEIAEAGISKNFDVIIFPDTDKNLLMEGKYKSGDSYYQGNYHPDYIKGLGKEGMEALMTFIDKGGVIISWGRSAGLFEGTLKIERGDQTEEFNLPFSDISSDLQKNGLYIPGSLLQVNLLKEHRLTLGMPSKIGVFTRGRPVFRTTIPGFDMDRRVIASYPEKDLLLSGYAAEEEKAGAQSAMIWVKKGDGQFIFFGFNPQFRASTQSSYKLLFNAILL